MKKLNKARQDWKRACAMGNKRGCENLERY
jgi:hypothetical protein